MRTFDIVVYIVAIVLLGVAVLWPAGDEEIPRNGRVRLIAAGLVCLVLVPLVTLIRQ